MTAVAIATRQLQVPAKLEQEDSGPDRPCCPAHLRGRASLQASLGRAQRRIAARGARRAGASWARRELAALPAQPSTAARSSPTTTSRRCATAPGSRGRCSHELPASVQDAIVALAELVREPERAGWRRRRLQPPRLARGESHDRRRRRKACDQGLPARRPADRESGRLHLRAPRTACRSGPATRPASSSGPTRSAARSTDSRLRTIPAGH